jgi:hypothetical protein
MGVFARVAAATPCDPAAAPSTDDTVSGIAKWVVGSPGLVTTRPQDVSVGGLQGVVLDVRMAKTWTGMCPFGPRIPYVPLIMGESPSDLFLGLFAGQAIRLYLLKDPLGTLAIMVADVQDAGHLDAYSKIIGSFHFKT